MTQLDVVPVTCADVPSHSAAGARVPVCDDRGLLQAIARLAATSGDTDDPLRELFLAAGQVMAVDGIGVMRTVPDRTTLGHLRVAHAEPAVSELERLQEALQRGPCRDSVTSGTVVVVDDVRDAAGRYGHFATRMLDAGLRSVVAVPLRGRGRTWGALDLYRKEPRAWSPADVDAARMLADVAVSYLDLATDRDEARAAREEVQHRALHDGLTGLPNRELLHDRIGRAEATARRHGTVVGVAFVDLDRFKVVNDSLGHAAGDEVLVEVARRLQATVRAGDTLARLSGDEFVVLWTDLPQDPAVRTPVVASLVARLRQVLRRPVSVAGEAVVVTASIGVVVSAAGRSPLAAQLVHEADVAMYVAKEDRDTVVVRDPV